MEQNHVHIGLFFVVHIAKDSQNVLKTAIECLVRQLLVHLNIMVEVKVSNK